ALLFPIDWPEPFGLAMVEAFACGTPVIARRRGSVPEIVTHGLTGLIGETDEELAALCQSLHLIDRRACRAEAERRFSTAVMAEGYEAIYRAAIQERATGPMPSRRLAVHDDTRLLHSRNVRPTESADP